VPLVAAPAGDLRTIAAVPLQARQPGALGESSSVAAARVLRQAILAGDLPPGEPLGEESLGRQLGISRTPIREALLRLQSEGLVDMLPNRPAAVRSFSADDLREMHSLRAVLEGHAAREATRHLTEADFVDLEASCSRYGALAKEDEALPQLVEENFRFHETIANAASSERLIAMIRQVSALPLIYKSYMTYSLENRTTAWEHHVAILEALRARDADQAERAMKAHVVWARDVALDHLVNGPHGAAPAISESAGAA
jgi:DNA-binding GntR family transcriptional regulator